jgi:signal transduction histidine kinase
MEAVGRLAGGIAHDFNNFLTVIMRRSNLLLLNLPKDHPHRKSLENIEQTTPERGKVRIDRGQVEQVLVNLVVNARDAMPAGGRIAIAVSEVELDEGEAARAAGISAGRYIVLAVADTGTGMDEHTKARIFEPFFTTKEPGKGTR